MDKLQDQSLTHNYVVLAYRILENVEDKFVVMACLHLGYTQREVADMLGVSQVAVSKRLKSARRILRIRQDEVIL